jgi:hypothetical protein
MNRDLITYVAARMYLQYSRRNGHHTQLTDEVIIEKFSSNWRNFFVSSGGHRVWLERAEEAIDAYEDWKMK